MINTTMKEFEYRIVKLKNGLGNTRYRPEFREKRVRTFAEILFKRSDSTWRVCPSSQINYFAGSSDKQLYENALLGIDEHKASNIWIEDIIDKI